MAFRTNQLRNGTVGSKPIGASLGLAAGASVFNKNALADAGIALDPMGWRDDGLKTKSQEVAFGAQSPADAGRAFVAEASGILARA